MTLSATAGLANARAARSNLKNSCANFVWESFGSPQNIPHFNTAAELWARSKIRYETFEDMPAGAIGYLGPAPGPRWPDDDTWPDGDVWIKDTDGIHIIASDYQDANGVTHEGVPGRMTLAQREAQTGRKFVGGMGDLEGDPIVFATTPTTASEPAKGPEVKLYQTTDLTKKTLLPSSSTYVRDAHGNDLNIVGNPGAYAINVGVESHGLSVGDQITVQLQLENINTKPKPNARVSLSVPVDLAAGKDGVINGTAEFHITVPAGGMVFVTATAKSTNTGTANITALTANAYEFAI